MKHEEVASEIIEVLHKMHPEAGIGISGSIATGMCREGSDIDLLFTKEDLVHSYSVSFKYKGISVSIFVFSKDKVYSSCEQYLYTYHIMPIAYIMIAKVIYDPKKLLLSFKCRIKDTLQRRVLLRKYLIDELKKEIEYNFRLIPHNIYERKKIVYGIYKRMISIYYIHAHGDTITQKQEAHDPFSLMMEDDYFLFDKLRECVPYHVDSYNLLNDLFERYILVNY